MTNPTQPDSDEAVQAALCFLNKSKVLGTREWAILQSVNRYPQIAAPQIIETELRRLQAALAEKEQQVVQAAREAAHIQYLEPLVPVLEARESKAVKQLAAANKRIAELQKELSDVWNEMSNVRVALAEKDRLQYLSNHSDPR